MKSPVSQLDERFQVLHLRISIAILRFSRWLEFLQGHETSIGRCSEENPGSSWTSIGRQCKSLEETSVVAAAGLPRLEQKFLLDPTSGVGLFVRHP